MKTELLEGVNDQSYIEEPVFQPAVEQTGPQLCNDFSEAFQEAQYQLGQLSQLDDQELQAFIDSDSILIGLTVDEIRDIFKQRRDFFDSVLKKSDQYDMEYVNPVDPKAVTKKHQLEESWFPTVRGASGKTFRPMSSGMWAEVDGKEYFGVSTLEGKGLSQIASEELSKLEQYFVTLLQMHPAFLLQKEYDQLYLFGFIDRRVVLSEEQRELRIAMRTTIGLRSAQQAQLIERFNLS